MENSLHKNISSLTSTVSKTKDLNQIRVEQAYVVKNEFKIIIAEGRWGAWIQSGKHTLARIQN